MIIDKALLITLSKIFDKGYTIQIRNNIITQYSNISKPHIVPYKTLVEIDHNTPLPINVFKHAKIPKNCIIGYWHNTKTNIGYIELNKTFKEITDAQLFAIKHKQQYVYDMSSQKLIEVEP